MKVMSSIVNCFKLYFGKSEGITERIEEGVNVKLGCTDLMDYSFHSSSDRLILGRQEG